MPDTQARFRESRTSGLPADSRWEEPGTGRSEPCDSGGCGQPVGCFQLPDSTALAVPQNTLPISSTPNISAMRRADTVAVHKGLWRVSLDLFGEKSSPRPPVRIAPLLGRTTGIATDPAPGFSKSRPRKALNFGTELGTGGRRSVWICSSEAREGRRILRRARRRMRGSIHRRAELPPTPGTNRSVWDPSQREDSVRRATHRDRDPGRASHSTDTVSRGVATGHVGGSPANGPIARTTDHEGIASDD